MTSGLNQRLRELDRKVLREGELKTAEGWRKAMRRWPLLLGIAAFDACVVAVNVLVGNRLISITLLPMVVFFAFQAGRTRTECERLRGQETFMGHRRPEGLWPR